MNILITGGAGFIGTNLIRRCLKEGHNVVSIDNYETGLETNHVKGCKYLNMDIVDIHEYSFLDDKPDVIFHLAALARIQPSFKDPKASFRANAIATLNVVDWAAKNDVPVIYAGTSSKHSGKFKNPYTYTKDVGEDIITLYQTHFNLKASITRFYNVYGPNQLVDGPYCTVVGIWLKAFKANETLYITGDGEQRRDFTHVTDIVDALYRVADQKAYGYEFELGRGRNNSLNEIIEFIKPNSYEYIPARPGEARSTLNTDTTAKDILGWDPQINIEHYIADEYK